MCLQPRAWAWYISISCVTYQSMSSYVSSLQRGILARSMTSFPPSPCVFLYRPVLLGLAHLAPSDTSKGADNGSMVTPSGVIGPRLPDSTASMFTTGFLCPRHLFPSSQSTIFNILPHWAASIDKSAFSHPKAELHLNAIITMTTKKANETKRRCCTQGELTR